jgi:aminoglycoside 6'-N-acetyltransferase I
VRTLENEAKQQNVATIWLGTDDDFGGTNLYDVDLYPNIFERLSNIQPTTGHPYTFYQKMGYTIVGAIPDANGFGKPDIMMAKRISRP